MIVCSYLRGRRALVFAGPLILYGGSMLSNIICFSVHPAAVCFLGHLGRDWVESLGLDDTTPRA
jgi:hypothetical protein